MKRLAVRFLAAVLGGYLALGLSHTASAVLDAMARREELKNACGSIQTELSAIERERAMTDEEVRVWAFRQRGLTTPGDVVFFDGGACAAEAQK